VYLAAAVLSIVITWNTVAQALALRDPALAIEVAPFHPDAIAAEADEVLITAKGLSEYQQAYDLSRQAYQGDLLNAEALAVAAVAQRQLGHQQVSGQLLEIAFNLSKRSERTNTSLLAKAGGEGNVTAAAFFLDLALRSSRRTEIALMDAAVDDAANEEFADALVERLGQHPPWRKRYLEKLGSRSDLARAAWRILFGLRERGSPPTPEEYRNYLRAAATVLPTKVLHQHWQHLTGDRSSGLVKNGRFDRPGGEPPFEWAHSADPAVVIALTSSPGGNGTSLLVQAQTVQSLLITRQLLALDPGPYEAIVTATAQSGRPALGISLVCGGSQQVVSDTVHNLTQSRTRIAVPFQLPATCDGAWINIVYEGSTEQPSSSFYLESVEVYRVVM
jgi:hypothetical protein